MGVESRGVGGHHHQSEPGQPMETLLPATPLPVWVPWWGSKGETGVRPGRGTGQIPLGPRLGVPGTATH